MILSSIVRHSKTTFYVYVKFSSYCYPRGLGLITKCEFFKNKIDYLGYIISKDGTTPNTKKIESITTYPEPTNQKELGSFLGLASYYRKFVRAFAKKAHPLTALTKKSAQSK